MAGTEVHPRTEQIVMPVFKCRPAGSFELIIIHLWEDLIRCKRCFETGKERIGEIAGIFFYELHSYTSFFLSVNTILTKHIAANIIFTLKMSAFLASSQLFLHVATKGLGMLQTN